MQSHVVLIDPKFGENVGGAIRACNAFDAESCHWTGTRVPLSKKVARYGRLTVDSEDAIVDHGPDTDAIERYIKAGCTPIAIELCDDAQDITHFEHPENALYIFGPEDGTLSKKIREMCEHKVYIPTERCLNLAATVNVVLYDRTAKDARE